MIGTIEYIKNGTIEYIKNELSKEECNEIIIQEMAKYRRGQKEAIDRIIEIRVGEIEEYIAEYRKNVKDGIIGNVQKWPPSKNPWLARSIFIYRDYRKGYISFGGNPSNYDNRICEATSDLNKIEIIKSSSGICTQWS